MHDLTVIKTDFNVKGSPVAIFTEAYVEHSYSRRFVQSLVCSHRFTQSVVDQSEVISMTRN
ncbi:MAG: hypothetical protein J4G19_09110, partial [Pseudomonadales bacterium]|nr:hypothetical protein [Pseudomonadales bacterium]